MQKTALRSTDRRRRRQKRVQHYSKVQTVVYPQNRPMRELRPRTQRPWTQTPHRKTNEPSEMNGVIELDWRETIRKLK